MADYSDDVLFKKKFWLFQISDFSYRDIKNIFNLILFILLFFVCVQFNLCINMHVDFTD